MLGFTFVWTLKDIIAIAFVVCVIALYAVISLCNWLDARRLNKRNKGQ